jgi:hypothetical protein
MELVTVVRKLRDGSETREVMRRWEADLVIAAVPTADGEPNTASIRVLAGSHPAPARFASRQDAMGIALAMAGRMTGSQVVH